MNEISKLNSYIIGQFQADDFVNTISVVATDIIDTNKENIYMLVNVDLLNYQIEEQVLIVAFEITILQQRDDKPRQTDNKLLEDTNYLDNVNETSSVATRFINVLNQQNNDDNIEIAELSDIEILKVWKGSGLDGVQFTIDLSIPNITPSC